MNGVDVTMISPEEELEMAYPARRASAAEMRRDLRALLAEHALNTAVVCEVVLAADEAFINAVTHAGGNGDVIHVSARVSGTEAAVEVHDDGSGFTFLRPDPRSVSDVHHPSGRGVFLIENMMDEVRVTSGRSGTTVRMVKHLE